MNTHAFCSYTFGRLSFASFFFQRYSVTWRVNTPLFSPTLRKNVSYITFVQVPRKADNDKKNASLYSSVRADYHRNMLLTSPLLNVDFEIFLQFVWAVCVWNILLFVWFFLNFLPFLMARKALRCDLVDYVFSFFLSNFVNFFPFEEKFSRW